ncbi:MAG: hypothetical protein GFH27_549325n130 [Chloroflexi bacterium AL-W]|nr:hypothetical protein [Chloroflexi bacterium AL-N1]NOK70020.1 hypothetical protein [Chloroflexi bacterium AL-N10]NOK77968.1 hypothetical protein [Chloroflexi bacterium AL-N5]NOK84977.1 hypothetical protein [Chloroflexi bacterium AL-W]NOK91956.1 hypothetical protein [Chloroflexi bacterium AL-N15]
MHFRTLVFTYLLLLLTLLTFLTGCTTIPETNDTAQVSPQVTLAPEPTQTDTSIDSLSPTATPSTLPTPIEQPTLASPATPEVPLQQALNRFTDDALVYARRDRFLMMADASGKQQTWLTEQICNMENFSAEQSGIWSVDGRYLAITCNHDPGSDMILTSLLDTQTGQIQPLNFEVELSAHSWSPTASQILIHSLYATDWYVVDASTGQHTRLITLSDSNTSATWSPDGTRVAVTGSVEDEQDSVYIMNIDGTNRREFIVDQIPDYYSLNAISWSPDGAFLLLNRQLNPAPDTYTHQAIRLDVETGDVQILADPLHDIPEFQWSPDGSWFIIGQSGRAEAPLGQWSLYDADGTFIRNLSTDSERDDIAIRWLPNSQQFVIMTVRLTFGVEIILSDLQGNEQVHARYPDKGPSFPALAIAPSGSYIAVGLSDLDIGIVDIQGNEQAMIQGRIKEWRPKY